jgi:dTDP-4-dehydrorhamnose 3,5-epimerase-like enzyme
VSLADCRTIELPVVAEPRGNLTFVESERHIPFPLRRVYYLYDVPSGAERGGHAHKQLHQLLIAISGAFDVHVDDGRERRSHHLNRPHKGLYIPPMVWREIDNFSGGSVCLALVSDFYEEDDYFRDYAEFKTSVDG